LADIRRIGTAVYLSGVIDIHRRPFELLGEGVWVLLELSRRLGRLDVTILLGRSLA
jgi:hypothetical protein